MTDSLAAKLEAIKNRSTRYEVVLTDGTRSLLVGYTARVGRPGLVNLIRAHGEAILKFTGVSADVLFGFAGGGKAAVATFGAWSIKFTGRTQRDAILSIELDAV